MKRSYIKPQTTQAYCLIQSVMQSVSGKGIRYAGVDNDGTEDPKAKERDIWADGYWDEL